MTFSPGIILAMEAGLKALLKSKIVENKKQKDKKRKHSYFDLFQGRDENRTYEDVRNTILLFADVFIDKIKKFGKTYGVKDDKVI